MCIPYFLRFWSGLSSDARNRSEAKALDKAKEGRYPLQPKESNAWLKGRGATEMAAPQREKASDYGPV